MNIRELKELISLMRETEIVELEVEDAGRKVRIKRGEGVIPISNRKTDSLSISKKEDDYKISGVELEKERRGLLCIKSPIVGTFYRSPAPDAPPYVEVGDVVKKGQILCIIEAMKLMNEIESDVDGRIAEILTENTQPVEYGEVIFWIEPLDTKES